MLLLVVDLVLLLLLFLHALVHAFAACVRALVLPSFFSLLAKASQTPPARLAVEVLTIVPHPR
jgi:hypothetical protein